MILYRRAFLLGCASLPLAHFAAAQNTSSAAKLIAAARTQIGVTLGYDGAYKALTYPNGDIARSTGVCTDVIIRAYRDAFSFDLQKAVHEDISSAFSTYPKIWGLSRPDKNIDHRRVPNLETWLTRKGAKLDMPANLRDLNAGDLLTMRLPRNLPHIAIVTDKTTRAGIPYIIHNIGEGTHEDPLSAYKLDSLLHARFSFMEGIEAS